MKVLVLVLGCRADPYPALVETIKRTWASVKAEDVDVLFYYGGTELVDAGRDLFLPAPDDLPHVGEKTIAALAYVLANRDFDLVFRTNCSSYVDLPNLRDFALAHGREHDFYSGLLGVHQGITFASGSGFFLSRDLAEVVVAQRSAWDHSLVDDVALGALLAHHGVRPEPAPRRDYRSAAEVTDVDTSQFHFRCRSDSARRLEDARVIVELHRAFCEARGLPVIRDSRARRALEWVGGGTTGLLGRVKPGR